MKIFIIKAHGDSIERLSEHLFAKHNRRRTLQSGGWVECVHGDSMLDQMKQELLCDALDKFTLQELEDRLK